VYTRSILVRTGTEEPCTFFTSGSLLEQFALKVIMFCMSTTVSAVALKRAGSSEESPGFTYQFLVGGIMDRPSVKECPKGPHSKEEWREGSYWDFCYNCLGWHYLYPGRTTKPKPKKRAARKKQPQTVLDDMVNDERVEG